MQLAEPVRAWLDATVVLLLWFIALPAAPYIIGAAVGGVMWGSSKNRGALTEIGRGIFFAVLSGGGTWIVQQVVQGGV